MMNSKVKTLPTSVVRQLDRSTIEIHGIPGLILMENAGQEAARLAARSMLANDLQSVVLLAGKGNNAGDAFVVARHLHNAGFDTTIYLAYPKSCIPQRSDAYQNLIFAKNTGVKVLAPDLKALDVILPSTRDGHILVIDGLLGTGIAGAPRDPLAEIIRVANRSNQKIMALDLPSGLDSDTGIAHGDAIYAHSTVTFGVAKAGLVKASARPFVGKLHLAPISIPKSLIEQAFRDQEGT